MSLLQQQQHQQVKRERTCERSIEHEENEGPEERKMAKGDLDAKEDLTDGGDMSIQVQLTTVSSHNHVHTWAQEDQPYCIQSALRRDLIVTRGEAGGNLLKVGSDRTLETIDVDFAGTDTSDPKTEFRFKKSDTERADALTYRSGDDTYYLKVKKSGKVNLRKLVHIPTDDKYFFHIRRVGDEYDAFHTIQSLKTKEYLHCSSDGKAFMREVKDPVNGVPEDRETWFSYIKPWGQIQEHIVQYQKMDMTFAENGSGIECKAVIINEKFADAEDSGKNSECTNPHEGNSEDAQKQNLEYPKQESSEDPVKEQCDGPEGRNSKDREGEVTPKEQLQGEEHNGESENRKLEVLAKENPDDVVGKISEEKRTE